MKRTMIVLLVLMIGLVIGLGVLSYAHMHDHDHEACGPDDGCITLAITDYDVSR